MYLTREYAPLPKRLEGFLGYARAVPRLAADIRANLRTPLPRPSSSAARPDSAATRLSSAPRCRRSSRSSPTRQLKRELTEATAAAAHAMDELTRLAQAQRATATDDFALGAAKFSEMLRVTERVDLPLEELELVGRKDLERNLAALERGLRRLRAQARRWRPASTGCAPTSRAAAPSRARARSWRSCASSCSTRRSSRFRSQEQALVAESPPYNRGNFAYISIPGPYENPAVKVTYYVAPPDAKWSAAERNAYLPGKAYLLFVSAHEVWPGHYLQSQFANAQFVARRRVVVGLRLRRGLGALRRGDDVRRRASATASPRCASAC